MGHSVHTLFISLLWFSPRQEADSERFSQMYTTFYPQESYVSLIVRGDCALLNDRHQALQYYFLAAQDCVAHKKYVLAAALLRKVVAAQSYNYTALAFLMWVYTTMGDTEQLSLLRGQLSYDRALLIDHMVQKLREDNFIVYATTLKLS